MISYSGCHEKKNYPDHDYNKYVPIYTQVIEAPITICFIIEQLMVMCNINSMNMWPDLPKGVLNMHSFRSHFLWSFDRNNNRATVHACTIAKSSAVWFYWGLIYRPVWCPQVLGWSVNSSNLPSQADSRQGITTRLAGGTGPRTGHWCSYILRRVELKTAWSHLAIKIFCIGSSLHFVVPHQAPPSTLIVMLVVLTTL